MGISIDGGTELAVDTYNSIRAEQSLLWTSPILTDTPHVVRLRVTGSKNVSSTGTTISIDKMDVMRSSGSLPSVAGDVNSDRRVNALDLSVLISKDGQNFPAADLNKDGVVGAADLSILLSNWTW